MPGPPNGPTPRNIGAFLEKAIKSYKKELEVSRAFSDSSGVGSMADDIAISFCVAAYALLRTVEFGPFRFVPALCENSRNLFCVSRKILFDKEFRAPNCILCSYVIGECADMLWAKIKAPAHSRIYQKPNVSL